MRGLLILALLAPTHALAGIAKGPFLQDVRTDRITVVAETDDGSGCVLHWGEGHTLTLTAEGNHHEGVVAGLDSSSCYPYRLECGGQASPDASFCTGPLAGEPFSFVIYGDTRSNHETHAGVVRAIKAEEVDFYINTGDLVSDGSLEEDWVHFFEEEGDLLREVPFFPMVGNHDEDEGNLDIYIRLFAPPTDRSESERYYSFTYGNARFIILDNQSIGLGRPVDHTEQGDWLASELEAAAADEEIEHTFVLVHENMYSAKPDRTGDEGLRHWRDDMLEKGVDYLFSGHDHHYMRGMADNGLPFLVTGGGGAGLYDIREECLTQGEPIDAANWGWLPEPGLNPYTIYYSLKANNYVRVDINGPHFSACTKQVTGSADRPGDTFDCFAYGEQPGDGEPTGCGCHVLYGPGSSRGSTGGVSIAGLFFLAFLLKFCRLSNRNSRT